MEDWCVERHRKEIEEVAYGLSQDPDRKNCTADDNFLRAIAMVQEIYDYPSPFNRKWMM